MLRKKETGVDTQDAEAREPSVGPAVRPATAPRGAAGRDLRIDFFRGLALLMVFLIHTHSSLLGWFTTVNLGFSDPAEAFVFLSGYTAGLVYGGVLRRAGWLAAARRSLRQAARIYGGHLAVSAVVLALAAFAWRVIGDDALVREMHLDQFLQAPGPVVLSALRLQFRPANLDVLPLFVVLFLALPAVLALLTWAPAALVAASGSLYLAAQLWGLNLPGYGGPGWFFNPFAWQSLFCLGVWWGRGHRPGLLPTLRGPLTLAAGLLLAWSALVTLRWHFPGLPDVVPSWLGARLYPISKTALAPVRLLHFLALAYLLGLRWPLPHRLVRAWAARPVLWCGQHSLAIYGWGVLLSAGAEVALHRMHAVWATLGIGVVGLLAQGGVALMLTRRSGTARPGGDRHAAPSPREPRRRLAA